MAHSNNATQGRFAMRPAFQTGLLTAALTLVVGYAGAQGAQQNPGQTTGSGQAVQPGQIVGRQGRGGPGGNFGGQMPFSMGTVTGGDPATGTIIIKTQFGSTQTIKVNSDAKFVVMSDVLVSSLKLGDQIQVQGVPSKINANTISAGELPEALTGAMGGRRNRGVAPGGQAGTPADAANPNGGGQNGPPQVPQAPPAIASASGKIVSKDPLMIELSDSVSVMLKVSETTKITKIMPATINTIKLGDTILASGTAGQDGTTFTATGIGININMGAMGGRGMFGGPGGFGGGPGGGRGNRGGRGGAQGGTAAGGTTNGGSGNP